VSGWIPLVRVSELWGLPHASRVLWRLRVLIDSGVVEVNKTGDALRVNLPEETLAVLREASPHFTLAA
jgi:predicted transcriptional regulator